MTDSGGDMFKTCDAQGLKPEGIQGSSCDTLSLPSQSAKSSEECEIFKKLKERHAVVFKTSCSSQMQIEKNDPSSLAKLRESLEKAITAYLHDNAQQIHSIIPYHYEKQIAIVIYTYNPTPDLINQEWSQRFLGFPVFIVNLMCGYAIEPAVLPDPYPAIPSQQREDYNKMKDKITKELAAKHSNLSSVSVDYRMRGNKLVADEVCLQIGVLTKGIVPLGEDMISPEIDGVPVDIVEVSATLCVQPMILSVWPVQLGVGIGVEDDNASTGTLGAVVKHNDSGELFLLSNAHVLCRKGIESAAIVHPSQQDYEELQNNAKVAEALYVEKQKRLSSKIEDKRDWGEDVTMLERELNKRRREHTRVKEQLKEDLENPPRKIGTFTLRQENFTRQKNYECSSSESVAIVHPSQQDYKLELQNEAKPIEVCYKKELESLRSKIKDKRHREEDVERLEGKLEKLEEDWPKTEKQIQKNLEKQPRKIGNCTLRSDNFIRKNNYKCPASLPHTSKRYGMDAAIASIKKGEFDSPDMFEMYEWPNDLRGDDGKDVSKISLNGDFMKESDVENALTSNAVVYKCGRTTGVTRGRLYKEINVRVGCKESIFVPVAEDQGAAAFPVEEVSKSTSELENKVWYNVLHIKSATVRRSSGRSDFCGGGDSGAIVFDEDGKCVGLLFGRIDPALYPFGGGLATPIHVVFEALNITLATSDDF